MAPQTRGRRRPNVFLDDRGYPDQSHEFDTILHNVCGGPILRRRKHPAPPLDEIDPRFLSHYDESVHGEKLRRELDLSHLDPPVRDAVTKLLQKYWSVFDDKGQFVPVKDYQCSIDTGNARPICVRAINYGPREIPIMRKCIASLEKLGHIRQIHDGGWLFKALLAPKPHQEHVSKIDDFVWRFCVNYIPLNQVTRQVAYPIPRCDSAVNLTFSEGRWMWLWDAPQGYHQIGVEPASQEKLAFAGPDATKWTYNVMPFGPVNGPATFIAFIHDMDSTWKDLARSYGISIDEDTNTNIIVDDILSWAKTLVAALLYMECQLRVCQSQNLSLSLRKSHIFPKRFEFVGIDVDAHGNRPAMSKHQLLHHWPIPIIVRDVAKFVGFMQFYSRFIPNFEIRIAPLRALVRDEYTEALGAKWTPVTQAAFDDMRQAILQDPCLRRYDHRKLLVLRTDFSAEGFGWVALQPGEDEDSITAMNVFMNGGGFTFMIPDSNGETKPVLHPVAFGGRKTRGNEKRLHSHLGEAFAGDLAINKNRHMCFGQRFVWVTDCYALKYVLSYDGRNPAILRLQMRFMCWDMVIEHRNDHWLTDADYFSRLGADLCYDPLFKEYIQQVHALHRRSPAPTEMPIAPDHQPYFRGPRINGPKPPEPAPLGKPSIAAFSSVVCPDGLQHLENWPVRFGRASTVAPDNSAARQRCLYNSEITRAASLLAHFDWAVYGFNSGHFLSSIADRGLPFHVVLAADPFANGRALFCETTKCRRILASATELLDDVRTSGITSAMTGYLIHSHRYYSSEPARRFWELQSQIVKQLRITRSLSIVVAFVHPAHDSRAISLAFVKSLQSDNWIVSDTSVAFHEHGDSVSSSSRLIVAVHGNTEARAAPILFKPPPPVSPKPIGRYIWSPFNTPEHAVSYSRDDSSFNVHAVNDAGIPATKAQTPTPAQLAAHPAGVRVKYFLHREDDNPGILPGSSVVSVDGLCPPFDPSDTSNLFGHHFGIEFIHQGHTYVRAISPFEFVSCFSLGDEITYKLSQHAHAFCMDAAIPGRTSARLFEQVYDRCVQIRCSNFEIYEPNQFAAPAAHVQAFLNGAVGVRLPIRDQWVRAYRDDPELSAVMRFVQNPGTISQRNLDDAKIDANFRQALRQSQIKLEDGLLIYCEPIVGSESYTKLQLVPSEFRNVVFVAFHSNPIGGHFNVSRTYHRIRLRFYWPKMFTYISRMCNACPGCSLANPTKSTSKELLYNFPIEAPFLVLHIDGYQAGRESGFEGSSHYLIGCCGMCTFSVMEPVTNANATTYASAIMKILLRFGFCHTVILDKDSKFFGVCREALDLLKINCHTLSGANHNPMLVERLNRYLNSGLKIMANERDSNRVALEAILLLIYAWNSCPVPGTDISRSMVALGREFSFPIDFATGKHAELYSLPNTVESYSRDLATRLSACREIADLLVREHRCWHRELVNSRRRDPRIYSPGDIVFARRATRSNSKRGQVDKLMHPFTGPWRVVRSLPGASYELEFASDPKRKDKKHASDLAPFPQELIPFEPVDGPDNRYGQLHKGFGPSPYKEAGIKGFTPPQPFQVQAHLASVGDFRDFHFPTLSELNDEFEPFPWTSDEERRHYFSSDEIIEQPVLYTGPPPAPAVYAPPTIPPISTLVSTIISSSDKLFFISHSLGNPSAREWRLVRVALADSTALSPSCLQDGRFIVEFFTLHHDDVRFNAMNQRYWLQYHQKGDINTPTSSTVTHLIRPSDTSEDLARKQHLIPFRRWVNLTHTDTFIHGPFDFATVNGRRSRDRISRADWTILSSHSAYFINPIPKMDLPSYSIHIDLGVHTTICDPSHVAALQAASNLDFDSSI